MQDYTEVAKLIAENNRRAAGSAMEALKLSRPQDARTWILEASVYESYGDVGAELGAIARGLQCDPCDPELFYMMGFALANKNINQAYLCMEQAVFYAKLRGSSEEDLEAFRQARDELASRSGCDVRNLSVVILSYNDNDIMQKNIKSFRRFVPKGAYEIVVVDNHSDDGVQLWLRAQNDLRLIENGENAGFPIGCNIGIRACDKDNDLLLLNNDAVPAANAVFWLRMALYETRNVGAVSAVSNNASTQSIADAPDSFEECMEYGARRNVPMKHPYEERFRFTGFCIMMKRDAYQAMLEDGDLLDARFTPAYFEDDDLGMRFAQAGYRQLLCHNAFVYHKGGSGFSSAHDVMQHSRAKFIDKWGFDIWAYEGSYDEMIDLIKDKRNEPIRVLQLDCGMGIDLAKIKYRYPYAYCAGIETEPRVAGIGRFMGDIVSGEAEEIVFPWTEATFDYIFASDALLRAEDPAGLLKKLTLVLAQTGRLICVTNDKRELTDALIHNMKTLGYGNIREEGELLIGSAE